MNCDQCGRETNVLNYAINHIDDMDLCADCFSHMPEERRGDYTQRESDRRIRFGEPRLTISEAVSSPRLGQRPSQTSRAFHEDASNQLEYTESQLSQSRREAHIQAMVPFVIEQSFDGAQSQDLGEWAIEELGEFSSQALEEQLRNVVRCDENGERVRRPFGQNRLMVINQGQRAKIRDRFKQQRAALAHKDAIIEQLRERLDRAKRGS